MSTISNAWKKPRGRLWAAVIALVLLFAVSSFSAAPQYGNRLLGKLKLPALPEVPYRLGLDLKGGTRLVYEADVSQVPAGEESESLQGVRDVIERRVNAFGVAEPLVQTAKTEGHWRVIVELAGIEDIERAIGLIGETPLLEFREERSSSAAPDLTDEQKKKIEEFNAGARKRAAQALEEAKKPDADFAALYEKFNEGASTEDPGEAPGGDLGFVSRTSAPFSELVSRIGEHHPEAPFLLPEVIETDEGLSIVRVEEVQRKDKEVSARHILICFEGKERCEKPIPRVQAEKNIAELKTTANPSNFAQLAGEHSTEPGAKERGGDLGFFGRGAMVKSFKDAIFDKPVGVIVGPVETQFGLHLIYKTGEKIVPSYHLKRIVIPIAKASDVLGLEARYNNTGLGGKQLKRSRVEFDQTTRQPYVALEFNNEGAKLFEEVTRRNVNRTVAIYLDGSPVSIPRVNSIITGGNAIITGNFTVAEARLLAQRLNAGALPVPITLLSQQLVGASLGAESIAKSLRAGIAGVLLIVVFMLCWYRIAGAAAAAALLLYISLLLSVFKWWGVTLTFAGIAGVILSIGMAVDANILIFERMKEELKWGKTLDEALREGFHRAWTSIRDSNLSSLITCFILYTFSSSNIKGFAVTLALGILLSLFSAITVTRTLLRWMLPWVRKHEWLFAAHAIRP